jgi:hypothetical protein
MKNKKKTRQTKASNHRDHLGRSAVGVDQPTDAQRSGEPERNLARHVGHFELHQLCASERCAKLMSL